ncbi:protein-disulfide reductase DsbD [Idiomarina tyrosinivorans]|uniref:Thiol:disulfide interchange protein DsbD n=1 Tax=Idiomarina tyrosinivorans TaxID=1445662 RepID=A0A432ZH42_9GAMM|nr:protein-disulfide reductase DsbD [Idiomarina tyrosinivorans]RUO76612.1 protein-disulfide reductase DsbD [Idiomarina tyrosinivorans]
MRTLRASLLKLLTVAVLCSTFFSVQGQSFLDKKPDFLTVDQAFQFSALQDGDEVIVEWQIEDGYYLYRHRFAFQPSQLIQQGFELPQGETHHDEFFGDSQVFRQRLTLTLPLTAIKQPQQLTIRYQGCADKGLCYPPQTQTIDLTPVATAALADNSSTPVSDDWITVDGPSLVKLVLFFILGIGLAFTPCVLPMYPIISRVVVGAGNVSLTRSFYLAFFYVQGMAITYALLGNLVAAAGVGFQAYFQHPAVLISLSIIFVLLALSLFGFYQFQLPSAWQSKLQQLSSRQQGGSVVSAILLGILSALVASPCTTAPLSGALLYIAQSGDQWFGGWLLYCLALGMGVPLILFAIGGNRLLPKAGNWMNIVKSLFAWLLLAVVVDFLSRLVSDNTTQWLWLALLFGATAQLVGQARAQLSARGGKLFSAIVAVIMIVLSGLLFVGQSSPSQESLLKRVTTPQQLAQQLQQAQQAQQPVMVDIYADWCVACKQFTRYTFNDKGVQQALQNYRVLQIDVSANTPAQQQWLRQHNVLGLPTILFFNRNGVELSQYRVTGFQAPATFIQSIQRLPE